MFGLLYDIAGNEIGGHPDDKHGDGDDYERLYRFIAYSLYSYRTAIGDLEAPNAINWTRIVEKPRLMTVTIWTLWMFQQCFSIMIFLNFLIGLISQSYEDDLCMASWYDYTQRMELNLEAEHVLHFFGRVRYQFWFLTGAIQDDIDDLIHDEWQGFVQQIRYNQKKESTYVLK